MEKKVTLSKELAQQMLNTGDQNLKAFALENYPELQYNFEYIKENVKDFDDILRIAKERGLDTTIRKPYDKIELIRDVVTNNYKFTKGEERHCPWFYLNPFRFGSSPCYRSCSAVSARMCYQNSEQSDWAAETFLKEYKEFFEQ